MGVSGRHKQRFRGMNRRRCHQRLRDLCSIRNRTYNFQAVRKAIVELAEMGVHDFDVKLLPGGFLSPILRFDILVPIEATADGGNSPAIAYAGCSVQSCCDLWSCPSIVFESLIHSRCRQHKFRKGDIQISANDGFSRCQRDGITTAVARSARWS
jgi:hypothetical protein